MTGSSIENVPSPAVQSLVRVAEGWDGVCRVLTDFLRDRVGTGRKLRIALDGYAGSDWKTIRKRIGDFARAVEANTVFIDVSTCLRSKREIDALIGPCLPKDDPIFGRLFSGDLSAFFDPARLRALSLELRSRPESIVICYGSGAALAPLRTRYDCILYFDLTREEVLRRNRSWAEQKSKTQSISPRRIYYVDLPVHDRHRKRILPFADFYIDGNDPRSPKILSRRSLLSLVEGLVRMPFRVKPLYEPGVWGGQWLKERRSLPRTMINCAYGFEIIAPEQSVRASIGAARVEIPFTLLMATAASEVMGEKACRRFRAQFPIRFCYDDTWKGGSLSVQVHPPAGYMRSRFSEGMHQAEMYYIFDAEPGSRVTLGLREGIDAAAFRRAAEESEARRARLDHGLYVNTVPARKGDILLIPPGTVHGAGANELVLEISSTPYRYTFKIYDYCRPDLDGSFRPLSLGHAFAVIRSERTERWVNAHLMPSPRLLKAGKGWRAYVIADSRRFSYIVHRIDFAASYPDDTGGTFHILNLVEGEKALVLPRAGASAGRPIAFSETILVPAGVGAYRVINQGSRPCRIVKAFPRMQEG